jgi:hypothetical protein
MPHGTPSTTNEQAEPVPADAPSVSVCESRPGRTVFIESGNTDGWIASDLTVEPRR